MVDNLKQFSISLPLLEFYFAMIRNRLLQDVTSYKR